MMAASANKMAVVMNSVLQVRSCICSICLTEVRRVQRCHREAARDSARRLQSDARLDVAPCVTKAS
jgi:hypothetical protein